MPPCSYIPDWLECSSLIGTLAPCRADTGWSALPACSLPARECPASVTPGASVVIVQDVSRWRPLTLNTHLLISLPSEVQSLWANQILSTYLNWWLRHNYFRLWKTNVHHIGNLLSASISTICPKSAHYSASGYPISSKSELGSFGGIFSR